MIKREIPLFERLKRRFCEGLRQGHEIRVLNDFGIYSKWARQHTSASENVEPAETRIYSRTHYIYKTTNRVGEQDQRKKPSRGLRCLDCSKMSTRAALKLLECCC